ncbi:hypothetical protein VSS37_03915 [Candidatus Thiothrix sp. Deng01]|uniref:Gram-positive cocci surface proteins LPxTG domain-containing protein n=1 Tax=Candidatus Thiothrix phosphatis TaxID=3112415 RepID=A0ABU6CVN9_9GAMM|nr:hypothetical protein [Candidatus Thiothrix sp. Deng01]MEB4590118.1 hypothetical protein [Candidatus Thiothrix sp. Deng01]
MKKVPEKRRPVTIDVTPTKTVIHKKPPSPANGQGDGLLLKATGIAIGLIIGFLLFVR